MPNTISKSNFEDFGILSEGLGLKADPLTLLIVFSTFNSVPLLISLLTFQNSSLVSLSGNASLTIILVGPS